MTIDLVDARGRHVGERSFPVRPHGRELVAQHERHPAPLGRQARRQKSLCARYARGIEQGALYTAAAAVDRAVAEARRILDSSPLVLLTGGAAPAIPSAHSQQAFEHSDLVLRGLLALI